MSHQNPRTQANILGGALIVVTSCATSADVITVGPSTGVETNPIQAAIELAADGDVIRVAPGIYTGVDSDQVIDLMGKAITLRAIEGPGSTIIDGEGVRRVILCSSLESPSTVIEGFTIRNGRAGAGAGMLVVGSSPTILNCRFESNRNAELGGGLSVILGRPSLFKCRFTENAAELGGAINLSNGSAVRIAHCTFVQNTAFEGGGIHNYESELEVRDSSFMQNKAVLGGGAVYEFDSTSSEIRNCVFDENHAVDTGGALYSIWSQPLIADCMFEGNTTVGLGGAIEISVFSEGTIRNSTFTGNQAEEGGAVHTTRILGLVTSNCRFTGNSAVRGSSLRFSYNERDPIVVNSEFCNEDEDPISGEWTDGGGNAIGLICPNFCVTDLNNDARIDGIDLGLLFGAWLSGRPRGRHHRRRHRRRGRPEPSARGLGRLRRQVLTPVTNRT